MSSVLDAVVEKQRKREEAAAKDYRALVRQIASDPSKPPAVDRVDDVLRAVGRSVDDLRGDVQTCQHRNGLREQIAAAAKMQSERDTILEQITKADAVFKTAEEAHRQTVLPLRIRRDQIDAATQAAELARAELLRDVPDDFDERREDLERQLREAERESIAARKHLDEMRSRCSSEINSPAGMSSSVWLSTSQKRAANPSAVREAQDGVARAESRVTEAQVVVDDLLRQQDELLHEIIAS